MLHVPLMANDLWVPQHELPAKRARSLRVVVQRYKELMRVHVLPGLLASRETGIALSAQLDLRALNGSISLKTARLKRCVYKKHGEALDKSGETPFMTDALRR